MKNIIHNACTIFLILCAFFAQTLLPHNNVSPEIQPGIIILLNGTSSAGKTTLVQALRNIYGTFEIASIDTYTRSHPSGFWKAKCNKFYKEVREKALNGHNVIVDTVLYHNNYEAYDTLLKNNAPYHYDNEQTQPIQLIKILVYCPLNVLVAHVQQRNNCGNALEKRSVHKAFTAFLALYTIKNSAHDIVIDTIDSAEAMIALQQALKTMHHPSRKQFRQQHSVNKKIIRRFHLDASDTILITPKHPWDLIVNTAINSPEEVALKIAVFLTSRIFFNDAC